MDELRLSNLMPLYHSNWLPTDDHQTYRSHMTDPVSRKRLEELGYNEESITYELDINAFRNPPGVDISKSILFLGCSYTFGIGLTVENTWPYMLSKLLGETYYNAALPGCSPDGCFRIGKNLIHEYKPKAVFVLMPDKSRFEIISDFVLDRAPYTASVWDEGESLIRPFLKCVMNDETQDLQIERNALAIEQCCYENYIPLYMISVNHITRKMDVILDNDARDLSHSGPNTQAEFANIFHSFTKTVDSITLL